MNNEEEQSNLLLACPWLSGEDISDAERFRRVLTIRNVCDYMRDVPAEGRAKSLSAFANQTKKLRNVVTFTVPPRQLLAHLQNVPQEVIEIIHAQSAPIGVALEDLESESLSQAIRRWDRLKRDAWASKSSFAEVARFIQGCSYTRRSYPVDAITEALRQLQIIDHGESLNWCCQKLSSMFLHKLLREVANISPEVVINAIRPWSFYRAVHHVVCRSFSMPGLAGGAFFGERGLAIKQFLEDLRVQCSEVGVIAPPKINLRVSSAPASKNTPQKVDLIVTWDRWEIGNSAKEAASKVDSLIESLSKALRDRIATLYAACVERHNRLYKARLEKNRRRRTARADRLRKAGEAYHRFRRIERCRRKVEGNDSARRALEIAPRTSRKMRPGNRSQRKDVLRQRRRANVRDKRRLQLKACEALRLWQTPLLDDSAGVVNKGRGFAQRLQKHFRNCDSDRADEAILNFASLKNARDRHMPKRKSAKSSKAKDIARWQKALFDFEVL
jgi:hypothetical protein